MHKEHLYVSLVKKLLIYLFQAWTLHVTMQELSQKNFLFMVCWTSDRCFTFPILKYAIVCSLAAHTTPSRTYILNLTSRQSRLSMLRKSRPCTTSYKHKCARSMDNLNSFQRHKHRRRSLNKRWRKNNRWYPTSGGWKHVWLLWLWLHQQNHRMEADFMQDLSMLSFVFGWHDCTRTSLNLYLYMSPIFMHLYPIFELICYIYMCFLMLYICY